MTPMCCSSLKHVTESYDELHESVVSESQSRLDLHDTISVVGRAHAAGSNKHNVKKLLTVSLKLPKFRF